MKARYLFEFCDQSWVPAGARECLFETMDLLNSGARSFNAEVADAALKLAEEAGVSAIVELGAGRAPLTTLMASDPRSSGKKLIPCDLTPNHEAFKKVEQAFPDRVTPIYESVDLLEAHPEIPPAIFVLCGVMHHIPFSYRGPVVRSLSLEGSRTAIFEPLRRTVLSVFLALLCYFPALMLPIFRLGKPGFLRRALWCWLIPIVPIMFAWDGLASAMRQWTPEEWQACFTAQGAAVRDPQIMPGWNSLRIVWTGNLPRNHAEKSSAAQ